MPTPSSVFALVVFVAGLLVFLDAFERITHQFCKRTPWVLSVGMVLIAACSLAFLYNPLVMGGGFIIGRALLLIGGRRGKMIFMPRRADSP